VKAQTAVSSAELGPGCLDDLYQLGELGLDVGGKLLGREADDNGAQLLELGSDFWIRQRC
jgi:hypothetical protein